VVLVNMVVSCGLRYLGDRASTRIISSRCRDFDPGNDHASENA
jgi:hypothetical protein